MCNFEEAWIGTCKVEGPCEKHDSLKCVSCGNKATHSCDATGQFCCGAPLCGECEHTLTSDGTTWTGNTSFYEKDPLPQNLKGHCKKSEQVYSPWYKRSDP